MASRLGRPAGLFFLPSFLSFSFCLRFRQDQSEVSVPEGLAPRSLFGDTATERRADRPVCHRRICLYSSCYFVTPYLPWRLRTTLRRPQTSVAGSSHENVADRPSCLLETRRGCFRLARKADILPWSLPTMSKARRGSPASTRRRVGAATRLPSGGRLTRKGLFGSRFRIPRFRSRV